MAVLAIENTTIQNFRVTVTAIVEDMLLIRKATHLDPDEWASGLCSASFELADDEPVPLDEDNFCSYLDGLSLDWQLVDISDYYLDD